MRNPEETWTQDALDRGDVAAIKQRVLDDPGYLTSRDFGGATPLQSAIHFHDLSLIEFLLEHGADPNSDVDDGYTCLLIAIESEDPASIPIVSKLIAAGADIHRAGINGWTPLHMAAARGHVEKARLLINAGARVNQRTEIDGEETPLMEAAQQGRSAMVRFLLDNGADHTMRDTIRKRTPLEMAQYAAKGADPSVIAFIKTVDYGPINAEILATLEAQSEISEYMRKLLSNMDMAEQYRKAADQTARDGDHKGVVRILSEWKRNKRRWWFGRSP